MVDADGANSHALTAQDSEPECWLDSELAVVKMAGDFYVVRFDGTGLRTLTTGGLDRDSEGTCTPSTRTFFFTRPDGGHFSVISGEDPVRLPLFGGAVFPSPDGRLLAWSTSAGLLLVNRTATLVVRKLGDPVTGTPIVWSPDSSEIAFVDGMPKSVSVSTGATRALVNVPVLWSPDGTKMLTFPSDMRVTAIANADGTCPVGFAPNSPMAGVFGFAWQPVPGRAAGPSFHCVDVRLSGAADVDSVLPEQVATFTFTIRNDGNQPATGVRVEPTGLGFIDGTPESISSSQGSCDFGKASCDLGVLGPGSSATIKLGVRSTSIDSAPGDSMTVVVRVSDSSGGSEERFFSVASEDCAVTGTEGHDVLRGTARSESICGLRGPDRLNGLKGRDLLDGGLGRDSLYGGPGGDRVFARDGERDRVECGSGFDTAVVDTIDSVAKNCENVQRNPR